MWVKERYSFKYNMKAEGSPVANEHCKMMILVNFMRTVTPKTWSCLFQIHHIAQEFLLQVGNYGQGEDHVYTSGYK